MFVVKVRRDEDSHFTRKLREKATVAHDGNTGNQGRCPPIHAAISYASATPASARPSR